MRRLVLILLWVPSALAAQTVVAERTLRAHTVVVAGDLALSDQAVGGAATDIDAVAGRELRAAVYKGQPILLSNLTAPALVERNQMVTLLFDNGAVTISVEGRALDRGGPGDLVRVMNTMSRQTVQGVITADGTVRVNPDS